MSIIQTHIETHLAITSSGDTPVDLLASETGLSKQRIKQAMQKGAVWHTEKNATRRVRRAKRPLNPGGILHLYYDEKVLSTIPPTPGLIADQGAYSVWDKPCGMLSQGSKWGDHCSINRWVEQHLTPQRPAFIVHRLDRAANGLILIGHEKGTTAVLAGLFEQRALEKRYRVIVHGRFGNSPQPLVIDTDIDGKQAYSSFTLLEYNPVTEQSLLDVQIESGRKHQIRRHLAEAGHPVVGDRLYGQGDDNIDLQLTAYSLAFLCPVSQQPVHFQLAEERLSRLTGYTSKP